MAGNTTTKHTKKCVECMGNVQFSCWFYIERRIFFPYEIVCTLHFFPSIAIAATTSNKLFFAWLEHFLR